MCDDKEILKKLAAATFWLSYPAVVPGKSLTISDLNVLISENRDA